MTKENQWEEVKSSTISWGKIGDFIEGTLIDVKVREVNDEKKGLIRKNVYEIKADAGEYHEVDVNRNAIDPAIVCQSGNSYDIWGGKDIIDNGMKKIKMGQKVRIAFMEQGEPKRKGYSGFKIIKIYAGPVDQSWVDTQEVTVGDM